MRLFEKWVVVGGWRSSTLGSFMASFLFAAATTTAGAQERFAYGDQCGSTDVQASCAATCAAGCVDQDFFKLNFDFCFSGGGSPAAKEVAADLPDCPLRLTEVKSANGPGPEESPEDCAAIVSVTQRVACQEKGRRPDCAANTPELLDRAKGLVVEVHRELQQYGDLLVLDFSQVNNREKLCVYSTSDLDAYYETSIKNPDVLNALQAEAAGIQRCQREFENYISPVPIDGNGPLHGNPGSDELTANIVEAVRKDLSLLKPTMDELTHSVQTLKDAASSIEAIARYHLAACRPEGTPAASEN